MSNITNWYGMSDPAILKEIGQKLKAFRLQKNITQEEMAQKIGLNRVTIGEIEKGRPSSLLTFIQILRGLEKLEMLNNITPVPTISPIQMVKLQNKSRQRASPPHASQPKKKSTW
ncbi:MAG: helix-turn-helix transcriptional regulator [Chitinophagaceae bacterium]